MTGPTAPPPRRRRTTIIVVLIVVLALAGGAVAAYNLTHSSSSTASPTPSPSTTPSPSSTASVSTIPSGCLGGPNRDNAMLLAAQKEAPHSTAGAVEVAAAAVRWSFRYPTATPAEAGEISGQIISSSASAEFKDLATAVQQDPNNSGGAVPDGTPYYLTTANGVWVVQSANANAVSVSIGAVYVINGAVSPQLRSTTTLNLVWERGLWRLKSGDTSEPVDSLFAAGHLFTDGC